MKIAHEKLKQIIKEELQRYILEEGAYRYALGGMKDPEKLKTFEVVFNWHPGRSLDSNTYGLGKKYSLNDYWIQSERVDLGDIQFLGDPFTYEKIGEDENYMTVNVVSGPLKKSIGTVGRLRKRAQSQREDEAEGAEAYIKRETRGWVRDMYSLSSTEQQHPFPTDDDPCGQIEAINTLMKLDHGVIPAQASGDIHAGLSQDSLCYKIQQLVDMQDECGVYFDDIDTATQYFKRYADKWMEEEDGSRWTYNPNEQTLDRIRSRFKNTAVQCFKRDRDEINDIIFNVCQSDDDNVSTRRCQGHTD